MPSAGWEGSDDTDIGCNPDTGTLVGTTDRKERRCCLPTRPRRRQIAETASRGPPRKALQPCEARSGSRYPPAAFYFADSSAWRLSNGTQKRLQSTGGINIPELRVNGAIRAKEVRVVAPDGEQIGVKKINEALWLAEQLDLDLVEVAPNARPPVCRLMDYGRYKYEQSVKDREARKKQTRTTIKELRMRVRIGEHDFEITRRKTQEFLDDHDKVKVTIRFRGRERERPEFGRELMDRLASEVAEYGTVEQPPKLEGGSMTMVLAPTRQTRRSNAEKERQKQDEEE
jgi:translation initiation factor IF-3